MVDLVADQIAFTGQLSKEPRRGLGVKESPFARVTQTILIICMWPEYALFV